MSRKDIHVVAIVKDSKEQYIFLFDDDHAHDVFPILAKFSQDPNLSFDCRDAARAAMAVRRRDQAPLMP